jgi:hypothetical protein
MLMELSMALLDEMEDGRRETKTREVVLVFDEDEYLRLQELADEGSVTVGEYVRACVLGPRRPSKPELVAEILRRR